MTSSLPSAPADANVARHSARGDNADCLISRVDCGLSASPRQREFSAEIDRAVHQQNVKRGSRPGTGRRATKSAETSAPGSAQSRSPARRADVPAVVDANAFLPEMPLPIVKLPSALPSVENAPSSGTSPNAVDLVVAAVPDGPIAAEIMADAAAADAPKSSGTDVLSLLELTRVTARTFAAEVRPELKRPKSVTTAGEATSEAADPILTATSEDVDRAAQLALQTAASEAKAEQPANSAELDGTDAAKTQNVTETTSNADKAAAFEQMLPTQEMAPRGRRALNGELVDAATAVDRFAHSVRGPAEEQILNAPTIDVEPPVVRRVMEMISEHAAIASHARPNSLAVVLKPDAETRIALRLTLSNGMVQAHARCESGNFDLLSAHWRDAQIALSARGVALAPLAPPLFTPSPPPGSATTTGGFSDHQQQSHLSRDSEPLLTNDAVVSEQRTRRRSVDNQPHLVLHRLLESWA